MKMNRRSGGGFGNRGNNQRFNDNHNHGQGQGRFNQRGGGGVGIANNYGNQHQQQGGWRHQNNSNMGRQGGNNQGGGGMNAFDNNNRQFQPQQQMNHHHPNQFASQLNNAVMRSSVGPNPGMMSSFGGNQDQPVAMVLPLSQATGGMMGGNMGMGMQSQNPFAAAVMNQQAKPMQVIVGNIPGLNPAAFGQQVLPTYGQGVGEQNMGMFGQQTQQGSNRFGRDNKMPTDRGRMQRNQKVSLVRRNEANDRGRVAAPRGVAKKRGIVMRDAYADAKKPRTTGGPVARNRVGVVSRAQRLKARRVGKVGPGNKTGPKTDKKEDPKKKAEAATNGEVQEGDVKTEATAESTEPQEPKPSKYDEVPVEFLVCKVCQKTMNDGPSFESHLTGKAHLTRVKILEEKFSKRAELLMCESKMCEDEIAVEMERQRRAGKGGHGGKGNKNHCKMCDCNYTVNWGTHKQSVWHRVLKEFLHPNCRFCKSQFVHRRDWVEHILSVAHLNKLVELKQEGAICVADQETTSQEELFAVHIEVTKDDKTLNVVNIHSLGGRQPLTDDIKNMLLGENGEIVLPEGEIPIPQTFDENVATGQDAILVVGGTCCKVCRIYIAGGEDETHCKSRQHFDAYVEYLKRVVKLREQKAEDERKAKEEAENKAKAEAEAAAKAAEDAAKAAEAKAQAAAAATADASATKPDAKTETPAKTAKPQEMEVEQKTESPAAQKVEAAAAATAEAEKVEEPVAEVKTPATPVAAKQEPAKTPTPAAKSPQRGGQNSRGGRGSPARGRGAPNRGGGGFNRGGRGGAQQQTPARNATPGNMRGGRGGQGRGGARGSPGRGRGRGGW